MELKELIESRYSVRAYLSRPVEKEKIEYILDCARLSPSACNFQPWKFYVVTSSDKMTEIHKAYDREWFKTAPAYIVVCKDTAVSWKRTNTDGKDFGDVDAAIAAEHICLSVAAIGLGTCWVCNFKPDILTEALGLADGMEPVAIFPLGYIDKEKSAATKKVRKPLSDVAEWI